VEGMGVNSYRYLETDGRKQKRNSWPKAILGSAIKAVQDGKYACPISKSFNIIFCAFQELISKGKIEGTKL
jgi:hypothetical protein